MSIKRYEWVACDDHACHCDVVENAEGDMSLASAWAHGFNQCRAVMRQGAEPVKTAYKLSKFTDSHEIVVL